jgi:hypothetical protein
MTVSISQEGKGVLAIDLVGGTSTANGGLGAVANPEGVAVIILRTTFYGKTNSTGAANLGAGVEAAGAKGTDILNDLAMAAVAGKMYNGHAMQNTAKTEITAPVLWAADKYITFTGSASTAGLTGTLYVEYVRV